MQEWSDQAIILRYGHFRETDLWLRALLRNHGLLTLFAFGGAKSRRRFCGCLDQFNTLECRIHPSRGGEYLSLAEASLVHAPLALGRDWKGLGMAANCMRFVEACGSGPETAPQCFDLATSLLDCLERQQLSAFAPVFFRLRLATVLGFGPDFQLCGKCGAPIQPWGYFLVNEAHTLCPACALRHTERRNGLRLSRASLDLLEKVQHNSPALWPAHGAGAELRQVARAIDGLVQFHLGLEWKNGTFRRI